MKNFLQNKVMAYRSALMVLFAMMFHSLVFAQSAKVDELHVKQDAETSNPTSWILAFEATSFVNSIECSWMCDRSEEITQFELQRSTWANDFVTVTTKTPNDVCGVKGKFCFEDKSVIINQQYFYRIKYSTKKESDVFSTVITAKVNAVSIAIAEAYPNPYIESTTIQYLLSSPSMVTIEIADADGKIVKRFQQGLQEKGRYSIPFSAKENGLAPGKYVVNLFCDDQNYQLSITETE